MSGEGSDNELVSAADNITDETTDSVYSNLANLLTALQSARPAGNSLDTCPPVDNVLFTVTFSSCVIIIIIIIQKFITRA